MTPDEQASFRAEGTNRERHMNFRAAAVTTKHWEATHPWTLSEYLDFLEEITALFGLPPRAHPSPFGGDFRL